MYALKVASESTKPVVEKQASSRPAWQECLLRLLSDMEGRDRSLRSHADRVGSLCRRIGSEMGFSGDRLFILQMAALLHDIGKLNVPPSILDKPGRLSRREFDRMKHHAVQGELILKALSLPFSVCRSVRCHHERYNGKGYPDGLFGREIPIEARILCVADTFDAMTEDRPYRSAMNQKAASRWIRSLAGVHFDPEVVESFAAVQAC